MSLKLEYKRQLGHMISILIFVAIIIIFDFVDILKTISSILLLSMFIGWYYANYRTKSTMVKDVLKEIQLIPKEQRMQFVKSLKKFEDFERKILKQTLAKVMRKKETSLAVSNIHVIIGLIVALIFFGKHIAVVAVLALGIGDAFSTIIGKRYGKKKVVWNKNKTWAGVSAFFITSFISLVVFLSYFPNYVIMPIIPFAALASFAGALIETLPADDNITVPIGVSLVIYLVLFL